MNFDPPITSDHLRQLVGTFPLTAEGRATIPKRLLVGRPSRGGIPHVIGLSVGPWIVSSRLRDIMEELEPGAQEFSPVEVIHRKSGRNAGTYVLVLPPPKLDAILLDRSELGSSSSLRPRGRCVLDIDVIRGHHFWRGERPFILTYFCSDELRERMAAEKMDGWDFRHRCSAETR